MKELFQERRGAFLLLVGLLLALIITFFFLFLMPLTDDLSTKEKSNQSVELEISDLKVKVEELEELAESDSEQFSLRTQIPETHLVDELLLQLDETKQLTPSRIENVTFDYGEFNIDDIKFEDEENEENAKKAKEELGKKLEEGYLEGLSTVKVAMDVVSPDYASFNQFLLEVETWERLVVVADVHFVQPAEKDIVTTLNPDMEIRHELGLVAFYYKEPEPEPEEDQENNQDEQTNDQDGQAKNK